MEIKKSPYLLDLWAILFLSLLVLLTFGVALQFPPRSDHWHLFYFFHLLKEKGPWESVLLTSSYSLFGHFRFQPLSHLILYLSYLVFGSSFYWHNLLHLTLYLLVIIEFYVLIRLFFSSRLLALILSCWLCVCYTHFDVAAWSYHTYILFAAATLLFSVMCMLFYHRSLRTRFLIGSQFLLALSVFCYEAFLPMPMVLLGFFAWIRWNDAKIRKRIFLSLGLFYGTYLILFLVYLTFPQYLPSQSLLPQFFNLGHTLYALMTLITNFFYSNVLLNIFPWIASPPFMKLNALFVLRPNERLIFHFEKYWLAGYVILAPILFFVMRKLRSENRSGLIAFSGLGTGFFCYLALMSFSRTFTDPSIYLYHQFRYQLIPNLFVAGIAAVFLAPVFNGRTGNSADKTGSPLSKWKMVWSAGLIFLIVSHLIVTKGGVDYLRYLVEPHQILITNVKKGLELGIVSERQKLYIDPELVASISPWNAETGKYPGTIEWLFQNQEHKFAFTVHQASLTLNDELIPTANPNSKPE